MQNEISFRGPNFVLYRDKIKQIIIYPSDMAKDEIRRRMKGRMEAGSDDEKRKNKKKKAKDRGQCASSNRYVEIYTM